VPNKICFSKLPFISFFAPHYSSNRALTLQLSILEAALYSMSNLRVNRDTANFYNKEN